MSSYTHRYDVVGMTCDHCARAVGQEIRKIDGVDAVDVDLVSGLVTVTSNGGVDSATIAAAVDEAGYELAN
jgi:copper chaperone CopZ